MTQVSCSLTEMPQDVLLRCVAEFLARRDQYKLFSLCSAWKDLLYQCRKIFITDAHKGMPTDPRSWRLLSTSEEHRLHLLRICGRNNAALRRSFRLNLTYEEVVNSCPTILQYIQFFESITITFAAVSNISFREKLSDTVLTAPTEATVTRFLQSSWQPKGKIGDLATMWRVAQQVSGNLLSEPASYANLRGVHRLLLRGDGSLFVESSPDSAARLHSVVLDRCRGVGDVASLQNVPEVKINDCNPIMDVFTLAHVDTLVLKGLQLGDISMLGGVRKLVLNECMVSTYPVPSMGKGQEWEFRHANIFDVSALAGLDKLTLLRCRAVSDISMLGHVQHLEVGACHKLTTDVQFPRPLEKGQEWAFDLIQDMSNIAVERFSGLRTLRLDSCHRVSLSGARNISSLALIDCTLVGGPICDIVVNALTLIGQSFFVKFETEVTISHLDVQCGELQSFLLISLSDSARANMHVLRVTHARNYGAIQLYHEDLANVEMLLVNCDLTYSTYKSENTWKAQRTTNMVFDIGILRNAVQLWCEDNTVAVRLFGDISSWDVSRIQCMLNLFSGRIAFNDNIDTWDVGNVTTMRSMFHGASSFNQPLNSWNVSKVVHMYNMFSEATAFNQPLHGWNVESVKDMRCMFQGASSFNQAIDSWNVSNVVHVDNMFSNPAHN